LSVRFIVALGVLLIATAAVGQQPLHWYKCNTHTHTAWFAGSDANASGDYSAQWYQKHGYQCLVITDHEHLTPVDTLNKPGEFLVIRGQEITQGIHEDGAPNGIRWAHVNGINTNQAIMPIGYPNMPNDVSLGATYVRNVDAVYAAGGIPQINHPTRIAGPRLEDLLQIQRPFLFEVFNAFPHIGSFGGVDDKGVVAPSFETLWDSLLSRGKVAWGVASDDVHDYMNFDDPNAPTPGKAWIVVRAPELTLSAVMQALRQGQFYASSGVALNDYQADSKGISLTLDFPCGWHCTAKATDVLFRTRFIGKDGKVLAEVTGTAPSYRFKGNEGYVRASVTDSDGHRAWTQPVFLDHRDSTSGWVSASAAPTANLVQPTIDEDATVHIPPVDVPFSDLASPQAKKNFLDMMRAKGLLSDQTPPSSSTDIKEIRRQVDERAISGLQRVRAAFAVDIRPQVIAGVQTDIVTPKNGIAPENSNRVLINLHGGGMLVGARYGGQEESTPIASLGRIKVVTVDYRMAPEAHFPAASEDVASVYRELLKTYESGNIGIFGCSSGAVLTGQSVAWFQTHDLPIPGAIGLFGEGAMDDDRGGDADFVAAPLGGYPVGAIRAGQPRKDWSYVGAADAKGPLISPARHPDVLKAFPPSLLISGTRDLAMSTVVYTHAQLVDVGVDAELHVWEGVPHCAYAVGDADVPETRQAWKVITTFFQHHLGR